MGALRDIARRQAKMAACPRRTRGHLERIVTGLVVGDFVAGGCLFFRDFLRCGAFFEEFLGGDVGLFGLRLLGQHVFAARLALGFFFRARDVERDADAHFRMQHDGDRNQADAS